MQIEFETTPKHTLTIINFCISKVLEAEIPPPSDIPFMFEVMENIAKQYQSNNWDKISYITFKLPEKQALCCWHCMRICIDNGMIRNESKKVFATRAIFVLAKHLDEAKREFDNIKNEDSTSLAQE